MVSGRLYSVHYVTDPLVLLLIVSKVSELSLQQFSAIPPPTPPHLVPHFFLRQMAKFTEAGLMQKKSVHVYNISQCFHHNTRLTFSGCWYGRGKWFETTCGLYIYLLTWMWCSNP